MKKILRNCNKIVTPFLIIVWVFSGWAPITVEYKDASYSFPPASETAHALEAAVTTSANQTDYGSPGAKQVWTSATDGYLFYLGDEAASTGGVWMASTTDGGLTWAHRQVDSINTTDAIDVAVWYDGWTDDATSQYIHIASIDLGLDEGFYTRLDLTTGAFSTTAQVSNQSSTITISTSYVAITKAHDGVLYLGIVDNNDSWVMSCSTTCTSGGNWSERTGAFTAADLLGNSAPLLVPVPGTNNIMVIINDVTNDTLDYNIYSATSSSWWFATTQSFATSREGGTTYEGDAIGLAYDYVRGAVYVSFVDDMNDFVTENHDVELWTYTLAGGWVNLGDAVTDASGGITAAKVGVNLENGYLYVAYIRRSIIGTATTGAVYYKVSYDGGVTWSAESAALNITDNEDNLFMLAVSPASRYRFGAVWKYTTSPNAEDLYFADIQKWYQVKRKIRLFEGYTIKLPSGRMIVHQE